MSARRFVLSLLPAIAGLLAALDVPPARAVYECGGEYDTCDCGRSNFCICDGTCGNCVWHAWHSACCHWGRALEWCTDAQYWNDQARARGYPTGMTPADTAIFVCEPSSTCSGYGHVGYVVTANADGSFSSTEQFWGGPCGTHTRTRPAGFATGGFIYNPGGAPPPPPGCSGTDDATFVGETVPDGTHFAPGASFTKTWTLRNTGTSTWTRACNHRLAFDGGEQFGAPAETLLPEGTTVAPGANYTWSVPMTAPSTPGTYRGYWKMDRYGTARFGDRVWVEIVVDSTPPPPTDADGDGHPAGADCDDGNPAVHPGAAESCNSIDDDCDGTTDEGVRNRCGTCGPEPPEVCDGIDNNCNGETDEGVRNLCGTCGPEPPEVCDGIDNNCNGAIDEGCVAADADADIAADADADIAADVPTDMARPDAPTEGAPSDGATDGRMDGWVYIWVEDDGCGCGVPGRRTPAAAATLLFLLAGALAFRRRRGPPRSGNEG